MPAARLQAFTGEIPRADKRLLPANGAQNASNVILTSGRIDPVFSPLHVTDIAFAAPKTIYRMYDGLGNDYWLAWDVDVDVARSPLAGDANFRIYFTGEDFQPRTTNLQFATVGSPPFPNTAFALGVVAPITAPSVAPPPGGTTETRTYVYTLVNALGDESAPSPASAPQSGNQTGTWALTGMDTAPPNSYVISAASWSGGKVTLTVATTFGLRVGERVMVTGLLPASLNVEQVVSAVTPTTIGFDVPVDPVITDQVGSASRIDPHYITSMKKRIYRSLTTATDTQFFFVDEIDVALTSYNDSKLANQLGEALITEGWEMPPPDMRGICMHPCGSAVGFSKNVLYVSEPGAPYAYPIEFQHSTDSPIVGIKLIGQSIVIGTQGHPYICGGAGPESFSMVKREQVWPCLSKRGMVSTTAGVMFPTPLGIAVIGASTEDIFTRQLYTQIEFARINPQLFTAAQYDDRYFAATTIEEEDRPEESLVLVVSGEWGISRVHMNPSAMYTDEANGKLYVGMDGAVWEWNADRGNRMMASWISREWVLPNPTSFGAAKIDADNFLSKDEIDAINAANASIVAANAAIFAAGTTLGMLNDTALNDSVSLAGDALEQPASTSAQPVAFTVYVDGQVFYSTTLFSSDMFRLPGKKKYDAVAFGVVSQVPIRQFVVGDSPAALKSV